MLIFFVAYVYNIQRPIIYTLFDFFETSNIFGVSDFGYNRPTSHVLVPNCLHVDK